MDRGLLWTSALSLAGLTAMGMVALVVEPPHVGLDGLEDRLGATVTVEGTVASLGPRREDWSTFRLTASNRSVEVVVESLANVSTGDQVRVTGQVGSFRGRIQIHAQSGTDIALLVPWRERHMDLDVILQRPWEFLGQNVRTSGAPTAGHLRSLASEAALPLRGAPVRGSGEQWILDGVLEFDAARAQFVLVVQDARPAHA